MAHLKPLWVTPQTHLQLHHTSPLSHHNHHNSSQLTNTTTSHHNIMIDNTYRTAITIARQHSSIAPQHTTSPHTLHNFFTLHNNSTQHIQPLSLSLSFSLPPFNTAIEGVTARNVRIDAIMNRMSEERRTLLEYLVHFFHRLAANESETLMNAKNMGMLFSAILFKPQTDAPTMSSISRTTWNNQLVGIILFLSAPFSSFPF